MKLIPTHMKTICITAVLIAFTTFQTSAQIPVTDVANTVQDATNQVVNLAEYVQMVNNQVQQIETLGQQLQQVTAYVTAFGDPASLLKIVGADELISGLGRTGVGQTIGSLQQLADGTTALLDNSNGLYERVGETFTLPTNVKVPRAADLYRKFDAIGRVTTNYAGVYDDIAAQRKVFKGQLADTTRQLQSSTTDAETQKLEGVVTGQAAQLHSLDNEVITAAAQVSVQDVANRNDVEKQKQARAEEQKAEFSEATSNYTKSFHLSAEPARFGGGQ